MSPILRQNLLSFLAFLALSTFLRLPFVDEPFLNADEAGYAVGATEWLHGDVPYQASADQKPPGIFALYAALFRCFGPHMSVVHRFGILWVTATAFGLYILGRRLWQSRVGLVAGIAYAVFSTAYEIYDMHAANTEMFMVLPTVLAVLTLVRAAPAWKLIQLLLVGVFMGLAASFKQVAVFDFAALSLFVVLVRAVEGDEPLSRKTRFRFLGPRLLALGVGFALPWAPIAIYFAHYGALHDLLFWVLIWPFKYAGSTHPGESLYLAVHETVRFATPTFLLWALGLAGGLHIAVAGWRARARPDPSGSPSRFFWLLPLWFIFAGLGIAGSRRFFGHYYYQILPPLCLLAAHAFDHLWERVRSQPWWDLSKATFVVAVVLGLCVAVNEYSCLHAKFWIRYAQMLRGEPPPGLNLMGADDAAQRLGAYLQQHTTAADRLFVWGYWPEVYWYAERRPASRFTNCNFIVGMYPGSIQIGGGHSRPRWNQGLSILLQELEAAPPQYIIDTSSVGYSRYMFSYREHPPENYALLAGFIASKYEMEGYLEGFRLYRRRSQRTGEPGSLGPEP